MANTGLKFGKRPCRSSVARPAASPQSQVRGTDAERRRVSSIDDGDSFKYWLWEALGDPFQTVYMADDVARHYPFHDENWLRHKSPTRYWRHLAGFPASTLLSRLGGVLMVLGLWSAVVAVTISNSETPFEGVVIDPFNLSATALSLLLTLRVSESYNRFRTSHQSLATISGRLRDCARCLATGTKAAWPQRASQLASMRAWIQGLFQALKCDLRPDGMEDLTKDLVAAGIADSEADRICAKEHPPSAMVLEISNALQAFQTARCLDSGMAGIAQQNLSEVMNEMSHCERVLRHPVPVKFTRHTSRVILLWLAFLPFAFAKELGVLATVAAVVFLAFGLLGIDDIAVQIEEPFTVIDIDDIFQDLKASLNQLLPVPSAAEAPASEELLLDNGAGWLPRLRRRQWGENAPAAFWRRQGSVGRRRGSGGRSETPKTFVVV